MILHFSEFSTDRNNQAKHLFFQRALDMENQQNDKKALEFYRMSLKIDPHYFNSWLNSGAIFSKQGKTQKAITCYQRAIVSSPDKRAYYNLASEYFKLEKYEEAKSMLIKSIHLDNRFLQAHLLLGYTFGKLNNNEKAEISIKNVLKIDIQNKPAMTALALLYYHTNKYQKSLHYVTKLLRLNPNDAVIKKLKANLSLKNNNVQESIEAFSEIVATDSKLKDFIHTLEKNKNEKLSTTIQKKSSTIINKPHKEAKDWLDLSLLSFFEGKPEQALELLKSASK